MIEEPSLIGLVDNVSFWFGKIQVLKQINLKLPAGCMMGFIGPDGVGKSTLLSLIAGARGIQQGGVRILDGDMKSARHRNAVCTRIAYMPHGVRKKYSIPPFQSLKMSISLGVYLDMAEWNANSPLSNYWLLQGFYPSRIAL